MANQPNVMPIPIGALDESVSDFAAPVGTMTRALNLSIVKDGTYEPRKGFEEFDYDASIVRLYDRKSVDCGVQWLQNRGVYAQLAYGSTPEWAGVGQLPDAHLRTRREYDRGARDGANVFAVEVASYGDYEIAVWYVSPTIYWEFRQISAGLVISTGTITGSYPQLARLGEFAFLLYTNAGSLVLKRMWLNITGAWGSTDVLTTTWDGMHDMCAGGDALTDHLYVYYLDNPSGAASAGNLTRIKYDLIRTHTVSAPVAMDGVTVAANETMGTCAIVYGASGTPPEIRTASFAAADLATSTTAYVVTTEDCDFGSFGAAITSAGRWFALVECVEGSGHALTRPKLKFFETDGTSATVGEQFHLQLLSRPRAHNFYWVSAYCGFRQPVSSTEAYLDASAWLVRWQPGETAPGVPTVTLPLFGCPRKSYVHGVNQFNYASSSILTDTTNEFGDTCYRYSAPVRRSAVSLAIPGATTPQYGGFDVMECELEGSNHGRFVRWADTVYTDGGVPMQWDSRQWGEAAAQLPPRISSAVAAASGSTFSNGEHYYYVAAYRRVDAKGRVHYSAPSQPIHWAPTTSCASTVLVDTAPLTYYQGTDGGPSGWWVDLYRTTNNGSEYYYHSSQAHTTAAAYVTFSDSTNDASISSRPKLYTSGGVLPNYCAESTRAITVHQSRIYWVPDATPWEIRAGKMSVEGEAATWGTTLWTITAAGRDEITGLASLGQRLYVLRRDSVDLLIGLGPGDTGAGNDWQELVTVAAVGCAGQRTVVETPGFAGWAAPNGWIYGITPDGTVAPTGKPVQTTTTGTCYAAVYSPDDRCVAWSYGTTIVVYWLAVGQWTTWAPEGTAGAVQSRNLGLHQRRISVCSPRQMMVQRTTSRYDKSTYPTAVLQTAWVSPAGVQGSSQLHRVGILAEYQAACAVSAVIDYDYGSAESDTKPWTSAEVTAMASGGRWQAAAVGKARATEQSWRVTLSLTPAATTGHCLRIHVLTAEVQGDMGTGRIPVVGAR